MTTSPIPIPGNAEATLRSWKGRHSREARWLTHLNIDWPGTRIVASRFVADVTDRVAEPAAARALIDVHLTAAVQAYRAILLEGDRSDRERLNAFLDALTGALPAIAMEQETAETLLARWLPDSLARVLGIKTSLNGEPKKAASPRAQAAVRAG